MAIISGGNVTPPGVRVEGVKPKTYYTNGVPTDAAISNLFTPANGDLAVDVLTSFVYERRVGVWTRTDTI